MADPVTLEDIYELFRVSQSEADRCAAEADRRLEPLEQVAANTSREVAEWVTDWDYFIENLLGTAIGRLFQDWGIEVQETARRLTKI